MKTPEEIKFALECGSGIPMSCNDCPYKNAANHACGTESSADALDYIEQLEAKAPKWISVEERLPDKFLRVLGTCCMGVFEAVHDGKYWRIDGLPFKDTITHWMPFPEPPEV